MNDAMIKCINVSFKYMKIRRNYEEKYAVKMLI